MSGLGRSSSTHRQYSARKGNETYRHDLLGNRGDLGRYLSDRRLGRGSLLSHCRFGRGRLLQPFLKK